MTLNVNELEIISRAIKKRIETIPLNEHGQPTNFGAHHRILKELLFKVETSQNLSQKLKSLLQGIAKTEMMKEIIDFQNLIFKSSDNEVFRIIKSQKTELDNLYLVEGLHNKIQKKQDSIMLMKDYLKTYNSLGILPTSKIYYSISGEKVYKVGIPISTKQLLKIELDENETCYPFNIGVVDKNRNSYMHYGQNELVLQLLNNYSKKNRLTSRMLFIQEILIHNLKTV